MSNSLTYLLLPLTIGLGPAHGAVIMVSPGQRDQAAIDLTSTGDEQFL